nr:Chain F, ALA-THR-GLY-ALA-GLY-ALA-GLY-ALA-GLY-THR-THR-PRO-GLY-PRO [Homo sapiens]
ATGAGAGAGTTPGP